MTQKTLTMADEVVDRLLISQLFLLLTKQSKDGESFIAEQRQNAKTFAKDIVVDGKRVSQIPGLLNELDNAVDGFFAQFKTGGIASPH